MGFRKVRLHIRGKTQVLQPCLLPLLFQQPKREMVLEAVAIPPQSRVVIFCFFVGREVGWGWGDERQGSKGFLPKAEGGVGKGTKGKNSS